VLYFEVKISCYIEITYQDYEEEIEINSMKDSVKKYLIKHSQSGKMNKIEILHDDALIDSYQRKKFFILFL
jgi:hypothetical protein